MPRPPKFPRLAQQLRAEVGNFRPGWPIPSARHLARRHEASPNTIRRALALLNQEGLIIFDPDRRRYVRNYPEPGRRFFRPYPRVAVMAPPHWYYGLGYLQELLGGFMGRMSFLQVPCVCCSPHTQVRPIPGGVEVATPPIRCSGIVLPAGAGEPALRSFTDSDAVVMTLDFLAHVPGVDSVIVDCEQEARLLVEYLASRGHRYIAYLYTASSNPPDHWPDGVDPDARRFERAMSETKQRLGLPASQEHHQLVYSPSGDLKAGIAAVITKLMRFMPRPTAIICFGTDLAKLAEQVLTDQFHISCPEGISIASRGIRSELSRFTGLSCDPRRMGAVAAEHIVRRMAYPSVAPCVLAFPSELVEGQTVANVTAEQPA